MDSDRDVFPTHPTFSQRHGYAPLPEAMKTGQLSEDFRRELCNSLHRHVWTLVQSSPLTIPKDTLTTTGIDLVRRTLGEFREITEFSVNTSVTSVLLEVNCIVTSGSFHHVLSFLEILLRHVLEIQGKDIHHELANLIERLLKRHDAAYRLVVDRRGACWFHPCESEEHAEAIADALETLNRGEFAGAKRHLRDAAGHIDGGRHRQAVTESIHAVESVARKIDPEANKTLTPALKSLQKSGLLTHDALRKSFESLYGYTSDEQGLRHALIDSDEAAVGVDESVFMFGACASFAGYLVRKHLASAGEGSEAP